MIYDIPARTGRKLHATTTIGLVDKHVNIVALKDASGELPVAAHVKSTLGDTLDLYSGDDAWTLPFMAIGAEGIVSVAAHWAGPEFAAMVSAAATGDWARARSLNEMLAPSCEFESSELYPNPVPTKVMLRVLGLTVGECRMPHVGANGALDARASDVLAQLRSTRD